MDPARQTPAAGTARPEAERWPCCAQAAAGLLVGVALLLIAGHAVRSSRSGTRPTELVFRADLNHADLAELRQLPGVGDSLARRIEDHRRRYGPFEDVDDLRRVSGVGPATVELLRPRVWVEPPAATENANSSPPRHPSTRVELKKGKKEDALDRPVDLNRASADELLRLPGIGPVLSRRIIEAREVRPFASVEDLRRVPGIGPKTLERLRPVVTVRPLAERAVMAR
jgi:competence protein ComEA